MVLVNDRVLGRFGRGTVKSNLATFFFFFLNNFIASNRFFLFS